MKKRSLKDLLNDIFYVCAEKVSGMGEDSLSFKSTPNGSMMCVTGGCSELGKRRYEAFGGMTGAYIGARAAAMTVYDIFESGARHNIDVDFELTDAFVADCSDELVHRLNVYAEKEYGEVPSRGMHDFPTTLCTSIFNIAAGKLDTAFIWAGNARGYILSDTLLRVTQDDVYGTPALPYADSDLSNIVTADGDFKLNCEILTSDLPLAVITATDGAYAHFATPMEFEYMLLETLMRSDSIDQWHNNIYGELSQTARDDFAICIGLVGYPSFQLFRSRYRGRVRYLYERYISRLEYVSSAALVKEYYHDIGSI